MMKKTLKIALYTLLGLLAVLFLAVLTTPLWVGPVAATVANKMVPGITGTDFKVEKIALNPFTGKLRVVECHLSNPNGYDEKEAFGVTTLSVDIAVVSLFTKKIHIRDISIDGPHVSYVDLNGTNNFMQIAANATGGQEAEESHDDETVSDDTNDVYRVVIDRLHVSGTHIKYGILPTLPIPTITLTDIGKNSEEGATWSDACMEVWGSIQKNMSSFGGRLGKITGGATDQLKSSGEALGKAAENATDTLKNAADSATDSIKDAGEKASGLLKDAGKGVKNLFN